MIKFIDKGSVQKCHFTRFFEIFLITVKFFPEAPNTLKKIPYNKNTPNHPHPLPSQKHTFCDIQDSSQSDNKFNENNGKKNMQTRRNTLW